jgi:hypothetical protein
LLSRASTILSNASLNVDLPLPLSQQAQPSSTSSGQDNCEDSILAAALETISDTPVTAHRQSVALGAAVVQSSGV